MKAIAGRARRVAIAGVLLVASVGVTAGHVQRAFAYGCGWNFIAHSGNSAPNTTLYYNPCSGNGSGQVKADLQSTPGNSVYATLWWYDSGGWHSTSASTSEGFATTAGPVNILCNSLVHIDYKEVTDLGQITTQQVPNPSWTSPVTNVCT